MRSYKSDSWFMHIDDLYSLGEEYHRNESNLFDTLIDQGHPDEVCHFCLTSGTTGLPKGAMLTHRNYINMGLQLTEVDPLMETDEYVSFLPFAWIGEQMNSFGVAMATGIAINFRFRLHFGPVSLDFGTFCGTFDFRAFSDGRFSMANLLLRLGLDLRFYNAYLNVRSGHSN